MKIQYKTILIILITLICAFLVLATYVFYPTTASASTDGIDWASSSEVGKTIDEYGVVATIKAPITANVNDNITLTYIVTNKRSDTIFVDDIEVHRVFVHGDPYLTTMASLGALKPGETRIFTSNFPIRKAEDADEYYTGINYINSNLRLYYPFIVGGENLSFNDTHGNRIGSVSFGKVQYETWLCIFSPIMDIILDIYEIINELNPLNPSSNVWASYT